MRRGKRGTEDRIASYTRATLAGIDLMVLERTLSACRNDAVAVVLAGGRGSRLFELTDNECKPALYFAGNHRLIDFTLANLLRSGITRVIVATQYRPANLAVHLATRWAPQFSGAGGRLIISDGGSLGTPEGYLGTADAVTRNIALIDAMAPRHLVVLGADHVYDMDYGAMLAAHFGHRARATVAGHIVPRAKAQEFGVIAMRPDGTVSEFLEKPLHPPHFDGDPSSSLASMGIYAFDWDWLRERLIEDAADPVSRHDFGHDILPGAVATGDLYVHPFRSTEGATYWEDVGTLDAYRLASLDFAHAQGPCRLPDDVFRPSKADSARGKRSLGVVGDSVLLPGARIGAGVRMQRTIVGPFTHVPSGLVVGEDLTEDSRWFRVTKGGTVLVTDFMVDRRQSLRPKMFAFSGSMPVAITSGN